jgi:hypothetical protein
MREELRASEGVALGPSAVRRDPNAPSCKARIFAVRVRLTDSALRTDLRSFLERWGCITYAMEDDVIEVLVPDASGQHEERRELDLYITTWRAHHPRAELELLDRSQPDPEP